MMRFLIPSLLTLFALPLAAQQAPHHCANVPEPAARLACYDKAYPPPPEVIEAAKAKARASFGLDKPRDAALTPSQSASPEHVESRITTVDYASGGQRSFNLENGQVWTMTESSSGGHVKPGDPVELRKGLLSGYVLVTPSGVTLRVRRIR